MPMTVRRSGWRMLAFCAEAAAVLEGYDGWLTRQPLAARTRDAYLAQVRDFVTRLAAPSKAHRHTAIRMFAIGRSAITSA
jgi:hypothetical protein